MQTDHVSEPQVNHVDQHKTVTRVCHGVDNSQSVICWNVNWTNNTYFFKCDVRDPLGSPQQNVPQLSQRCCGCVPTR